jgi:ribonuclease P protein component
VQRVFETGTSTHGTRMVVLLAPGLGGFTVVASRRVGSAVRRNRARRILREAWGQVAPQAKREFDVVLVAKPAIVGAKTQDLVAEMADLLRRAGMVRA